MSMHKENDEERVEFMERRKDFSRVEDDSSNPYIIYEDTAK
jgi:hypothetical protein